jgi:hypothetical protein
MVKFAATYGALLRTPFRSFSGAFQAPPGRSGRPLCKTTASFSARHEDAARDGNALAARLFYTCQAATWQSRSKRRSTNWLQSKVE